MPKSKRAYKSAKRSRELDRIKKQEKKRLRRLGLDKPAGEGEEPAPPLEETPAQDAETPAESEGSDPDDPS